VSAVQIGFIAYVVGGFVLTGLLFWLPILAGKRHGRRSYREMSAISWTITLWPLIALAIVGEWVVRQIKGE
jgi:amino acid permease